MLAKVLVGLLVALAVALIVLGGKGRISGAKARALISEGGVLLDVRTSAEFAGGHLPGAENIPVQDLRERLGELDKSRAVVLYCRSGARSGRAKRILESSGFENVVDLGAMSRW